MQSKPPSNNAYLTMKVMTASPEELQLMLYDGAIRFCQQARAAMEQADLAASCQALTRAQKIMLEMCTSMKSEHAPEACANMKRLYMFCYERLVQANMDRDVAKLDEAMEVIDHMRQTWLMLMDKLKEERAEGQTLDLETFNEAMQQGMEVGAANGLDSGIVGSTINFEG